MIVILLAVFAPCLCAMAYKATSDTLMLRRMRADLLEMERRLSSMDPAQDVGGRTVADRLREAREILRRVDGAL